MLRIKKLAFSISMLFAANVAFAEGVTILHVGDQESWLLSAQGNLRDNSSQVISYYGGIDRLATVIANAQSAATAAGKTVIKLNAGDAFLPGPRFTASFANLATAHPDGGQDFYDAIAMRQIGFDATVFGNHEFDVGPTIAARYAEVTGTTYLSANLNFDATAEFSALKAAGKVAPSKIVTTLGGKKIGIVGATTPLLPSISSPGVVNLFGYSAANTELQNLQALIPIIQAEVNRLRTTEGVNTVILMSHLQNANNEINTVVPALNGVDLVVSGGGHELMKDSDDLVINGGVAPTFNTHPVFTTDASGKQVAVLTGHFGNRYVGEVNLTIDDTTGALSSVDSTKMIRVSGFPGGLPDNAATPTFNEAIADADRVVGDANLNAAIITPVNAYISALNAQIIGTTATKLNGPTHTRCTPVAPATRCIFVAGVRNAETGLGNLVADAMRYAGEADVAIQNGGGIRTNIAAAGNVSVGDTFNILPFTNLVKRAPSMNATQLKDLLEHAYAPNNPNGENNGRYAQVSGMKVIYDTTRTPRASNTVPGDRIRRVVLDDGTVLVDNGVVVNTTRTFSFATIDFTANGGDGYPFAFNNVVFENSPFTITYQEALANYIQTPKSAGGLGRLNAADGDEITTNMYGLENQYDNVGRLIDAAIAVTTPGVTRTGTAGRDTLVGTTGDDTIIGGLGVDTLTGGAGGDTFVFNSLREAGDTITDFTPYADKIQLSSLGLGVNAISNGNIVVIDITGGVSLQIDTDGTSGPIAPRTLVNIKGLTAAQIAPARDFVL